MRCDVMMISVLSCLVLDYDQFLMMMMMNMMRMRIVNHDHHVVVNYISRDHHSSNYALMLYVLLERGEVVEVKVVKIVPETRTIRLELR